MKALIRVTVLSLPLLALAGPLLALAGCSVNPATGEQSFTAFMSRADEMEIGKKEHPKILKEFGGAYADRDLAAYVRNIGVALAQVSEVPDMPYTFTVLNTDNVNAFALPGGYIYITRGLLALADNEAEMASVLAHELGHVTARHMAERYSKAVATNIGLTLLGALGSAAGVPSELGRLASYGTQAYLQSFSREQELQADMLGVRYMSRLGFDPNAAVRFLGKLKAHTKLEAALAGHPEDAERSNIMSTHPRTTERIQQAIRLAQVAPVANPRVGRGDYIARVDGMLFGDDPKQGVRAGRVFSHPGMGFRFEVPPGFVMFNSPARLVARGADGAVIVFDMETPKKAKTFDDVLVYLTRPWGRELSLKDVQRIEVNGLNCATGLGSASILEGTRDLRLVAIHETRERIFRFAFITPPAATARLARDLQRTTFSFRRLSPEEAAAIRPLRLRFVVVEDGDTAASLAARMPFEKFALEWFETLNGLQRGEPLVAGSVVKTVGY